MASQVTETRAAGYFSPIKHNFVAINKMQCSVMTCNMMYTVVQCNAIQYNIL